MSSEILEKQHFSTASVACGCGSKTASKKITSSRAENTMPLKVLLLLVLVLVYGYHSRRWNANLPPGGKPHASEGRASSKTTPKNCLTCRLKFWKNNIFRQLLLPAGAAVKQLRKNHLLPGGKHHASEGVVVVGIGVGVWIPFETLKRQLTSRGKTPCFWRTS